MSVVMEENSDNEQLQLPNFSGKILDDAVLARCWAFVLQTEINTDDDVTVAKQLHNEMTWYLQHMKSRTQIVRGLQSQLETKIDEFECHK